MSVWLKLSWVVVGDRLFVIMYWLFGQNEWLLYIIDGHIFDQWICLFYDSIELSSPYYIRLANLNLFNLTVWLIHIIFI